MNLTLTEVTSIAAGLVGTPEADTYLVEARARLGELVPVGRYAATHAELIQLVESDLDYAGSGDAPSASLVRVSEDSGRVIGFFNTCSNPQRKWISFVWGHYRPDSNGENDWYVSEEWVSEITQYMADRDFESTSLIAYNDYPQEFFQAILDGDGMLSRVERDQPRQANHRRHDYAFSKATHATDKIARVANRKAIGFTVGNAPALRGVRRHATNPIGAYNGDNSTRVFENVPFVNKTLDITLFGLLKSGPNADQICLELTPVGGDTMPNRHWDRVRLVNLDSGFERFLYRRAASNTRLSGNARRWFWETNRFPFPDGAAGRIVINQTFREKPETIE